MGSAAGKANGASGEWAGEVIPLDELIAPPARFGMIVGLDASPDADKELRTAQLAHALVGAVEAHARCAEQAHRDAGAEPSDITQASLMACAGLNCERESEMSSRSSCGAPPASQGPWALWTSQVRSHARAKSAPATH